MKNQMQATLQGRFGPNSYRTTAKVVGVVYLLGFVVGLVGEGLIQSSLGGPDRHAGVGDCADDVVVGREGRAQSPPPPPSLPRAPRWQEQCIQSTWTSRRR